MVDYVINRREKTFTYRCRTDEITIGGYNLDDFTDSEITEFISDCLTHEHIHRILDKLFDNIVSKLFDGIENKFRNDKLHQRHLKGTTRFTYQAYIKKKGYKSFLKHYGLNDCDVLNANILCNTRKESMLQHGGF